MGDEVTMEKQQPEAIVVQPDNDLVEAPHFDTLHGKALVNGERLEVTWPDGSTTVEITVIERRRPPYEYGGRIYQAYDDRAFISKDMNGATIHVYLRWTPGLLAVRQQTPFSGNE